MRANDREESRKSYSGDPEVDAVTARVRAAIEESNYRRTKSSDTSRMNKIYKPKSSPGPISNTLNLYGAPKPNFEYSAPGKQKQAKRPDANRANLREGRIPKKPAKRNTGRGD
jgi:hypothetical protein